MGNRKSKIIWEWPLIRYEWLPEILKTAVSFDYFSWELLQRDCSQLSENKNFTCKIIEQVKSVLYGFGLIDYQMNTV